MALRPAAAWQDDRGAASFLPQWAGVLSQVPAEEWFKGYADMMRRTDKAIARARAQAAYAENVLAHLYLIRDRLATMEIETAKLLARTR